MKLRSLLLVLLAASSLSLQAKEKRDDTQLSRQGKITLGLAQSYLSSGDAEGAMIRVQRAKQSDPRAPEVYAVEAAIHARLGDQTKAAEAFAQALRLDPSRPSIQNNYGVWLCEQGRYPEAEAAFALALADNEYRASGQPLFNAGRCATKAGKYDQAEAYYRQLLEKSPDDAAVLMAMAEIKLASGNAFEARAFLQRREALGANAEVLSLGARIEDAAGDARAAAQYRKRLREEFPAHTAPNGEGAARP
ncbi:type IV pilus biogenesis/stability protein PilW [Arenimonas sp.]|uniref:type IV pilus biogenesis/stability protein PilW n=1 Tax=Arenimonas sp. TaxID=1872635 RepID=UPI0039E6B25F